MGRDLTINSNCAFGCEKGYWTRRNDQISELPRILNYKLALLHLLRLVINLLLFIMKREEIITTCAEIVDQEVFNDRDKKQTIETIHLLGFLTEEHLSGDQDEVEINYS